MDPLLQLQSFGGDRREQERFLHAAGLPHAEPSTSGVERPEVLARWLRHARERLVELEYGEPLWRDRPLGQRLAALALSSAFWGSGLALTYMWSVIVFTLFAWLFVVCMFGAWRRARRIRRLRNLIHVVEATLAGRTGAGDLVH